MPEDLKKEGKSTKKGTTSKETDDKKKQPKKASSTKAKAAKTTKTAKTAKTTKTTAAKTTKAAAAKETKATKTAKEAKAKEKTTQKKATTKKSSTDEKSSAKQLVKTQGKKETEKKTVAKAAKKEETKKPETKKEPAAKKTVSEDLKLKKDVVVKNNNLTSFINIQQVQRKFYLLDATGKALGRVAALAASMLRGKHKVDFTPNVDCGDFVIIINCKDMVLTGKKIEQKIRYRHSGWIGGMKETKYSDLMKKNPHKAMWFAVKGMLPHNSLGEKMIKHLRVYSDDKHSHEAQKPELIKI